MLLEGKMTHTKHKPDPGVKGRPYLEECDIGSGERTPAQEETDRMIEEIPPLPQRQADTNAPQGGQHGNPAQHQGGNRQGSTS